MKKVTIKPAFIKTGMLLLGGFLAFLALILPIAIRPNYYQLSIGAVSAVDILAPRNLTYESTFLTDQARNLASAEVQDVFSPSVPDISRQQLSRLNALLDFIDITRNDPYSTIELAMTDLSAIQGDLISQEIIGALLSETEVSWQSIRQESLRILEEEMRSPITSDEENTARTSIPSLISLSLSESQSEIITALVEPFITANSFLDEATTNALRDQIRNNTPPVSESYITGETILRRGQVVTPLAWEALDQYGLIQREIFGQEFWATLALVFVCVLFTLIYFTHRRLQVLQDIRSLLTSAIVFIVFLVAARFLIPNRAVVPYLFPIPAFGLTIAALFSLEAGMLFSVILSILASYGLTNSLDLTVFYSITSLCGILILGRGRRVAAFFLSGLAIAVSGIAVIVAYRLPDTITDLMGLTTLFLAAVFCGFASSSLTLDPPIFFESIVAANNKSAAPRSFSPGSSPPSIYAA